MVHGRRRLVASLVLASLATLALAWTAVAITGATARWSFDEGSGQVARDGVGSLDGGVTGAARITDGVSGGALRFDGGDRVTIPDNPVLRSPDISVSVWVRGDPDHPPADGAVILEKGGKACDGGAYALIVDGTHVALRFRDAEVGAMQVLHVGPNPAFPTLWDGAWHQVGFPARPTPMARPRSGWTGGCSAPSPKGSTKRDWM